VSLTSPVWWERRRGENRTYSLFKSAQIKKIILNTRQEASRNDGVSRRRHSTEEVKTMNWETHSICDKCMKPTEKVKLEMIRVRVYYGPTVEAWCTECLR